MSSKGNHPTNNPATSGAVSQNAGRKNKQKKKKPQGGRPPRQKKKNSKRSYTGAGAMDHLSTSLLKELILDTPTVHGGLVVHPRSKFLAALVNPRESMGIRLPDDLCREETATYQTKRTYNVKGVTGTLVDPTANKGRFCYVFNPTFSAQGAVFSATLNSFPFAFCDGANATAQWNNVFTASVPGGNFNTYELDQEVLTFARTDATGLMNDVRPVSMSVLCTYNGNLVDGGGNIAIALVRGDSWQKDLTNGSATRLIKNWENLATYPGAYEGPLARGGYAYWLPDDESDYLLRPVMPTHPDNTVNHAYPFIVVSGQCTNPGTSQLRVECYINWEYTTDSRVVETRHGSKDANLRRYAMKRLGNEPTSMPNDDHINWMRVLLGGVGGFVVGGPVGGVLGAIAGAGVSTSGLYTKMGG